MKEEGYILLYMMICLNAFHLSPITDDEMNEMVLSQVIILLYQRQYPQLLEFTSSMLYDQYSKSFRIGLYHPDHRDVTNDNSNKTSQQALSPVLAVMLSDGGHFFSRSLVV